jgi:hypothetical protein
VGGLGVNSLLYGDTDRYGEAGDGDVPDGMSTVVATGKGVDIRDANGDIIDTGLSQITSATEMDGGWLLNGVIDPVTSPSASTEDPQVGDSRMVVRYVRQNGAWDDLAAIGTNSSVFPNERGDAAVVSTFDTDGEREKAEIFSFDDGGRSPESLDKVTVPPELIVGGMAGDTVWFSAVETTKEHELGTWKAPDSVQPITTSFPVEPLAAVGKGLLLADISDEAETFCPALVDPQGDFEIIEQGSCHKNLLVYPGQVVVSPGGGELLAYVEEKGTTPGEWMWLDMYAEGDLTATGHSDHNRPVIAPDGTVVYSNDDAMPVTVIPQAAAN